MDRVLLNTDRHTDAGELQEKQKMLFIVNPFAGIGQKKNFQQLLESHLDREKFEYRVEYTTHPGHAKELAALAVAQKFDIVAAVGGDGSVNEIASVLIDSEVILGIVPAGSGNGFAGYLGYTRNIIRSIRDLNTAVAVRVDTCLVNDRPYVNVAGVGFNAWIAYKTKTQKFRGFFGYAKTALQETLAYQIQDYHVRLDDHSFECSALSIEVANATMFGYNMQIAPLAKSDDGMLDVVIVKKAPKLRYFPSMIRFPLGKIHQSSLVDYRKAKEVVITPKGDCSYHVDGEGFLFCNSLRFSLKPLSLKVLKPQLLRMS